MDIEIEVSTVDGYVLYVSAEAWVEGPYREIEIGDIDLTNEDGDDISMSELSDADRSMIESSVTDAVRDADERDVYNDPRYSDDDFLIDGVGFADPGGNSALRAATASNPRNLPCPTCGAPDRLTPADVARGYQCDRCSDQAERGF